VASCDLAGLTAADMTALKALYGYLNRGRHDRAAQLEHRLALARFWGVREGARILEVGCGQGDTSVVLAAVAGTGARITAVDSAPPEYGAPMTLAQSHELVAASPLGARIEFMTATDLSDPAVSFPDQAFDLVVFSHSAWYLGSIAELERLFSRARAWAARLAYAEWDLRPARIAQLPHMLAVLLQLRVQAAHLARAGCHLPEGNIRTLVLPSDAARIAAGSGWQVISERRFTTSAPLRFGRVSEIAKALAMAESLLGLGNSGVPADTMLHECELLRCASSNDNESLDTHAFVAA
jgi:SAM-dependent methyltransferase